MSEIDDKLNYGGGKIAEGWADVTRLVEEQRTGSFLKLRDGEEAMLTFIGKPMSYFTHRVVVKDTDGRPVRDDQGNRKNKLVVCRGIYKGETCPHCEEEVPASLRTVCGIIIMVTTDGKLTAKYATALEGGPKMWKNRMLPVISEFGPDHIFKIKRIGSGLQTDYAFSGSARLSRTPAINEQIAALETPNLVEILRLGEDEIEEEVPF